MDRPPKGYELVPFGMDWVLQRKVPARQPDTEAWWLVFRESDHWLFSRLLKAGFQHCYLARWDGFNWLIVEPYLAYADVQISPVIESNPRQVLRGYMALRVPALRDPHTRDRTRAPWMLGVLSCVELVKHVLGYRAPLVFTPWQLFKYIRKRYGIEAEGTESEPRIARAGATAAQGTAPAGGRGEPQKVRPGPRSAGPGVTHIRD